MPGTAYSKFQVGGASEPLSTTSANELLQDADPSVFYALSFWQYCINTFVGPRLFQAAVNVGATAITSANIATVLPHLPTDAQMSMEQIAFPLLAVGRTKTETGRFTASWEHDRGRFSLIYALPPLDPAWYRSLYPVLRAVEATLRYKTTQGFDPNYTPPGGTLGSTVWGGASAVLPALERVGFGDPYRDPAECSSYGFLEGAGNLLFPALTMTGYFVERDMYVSIGNTFTGADFTVNIVAPDQTSTAFMSLATNVAPTVSSLSVTSGTHNGGTSVTITGTGFINQKLVVLFGNTLAPASSIVWNSATSITCTTPAVAGASASAMGVIVINNDGQSGTLPNAYTYT